MSTTGIEAGTSVTGLGAVTADRRAGAGTAVLGAGTSTAGRGAGASTVGLGAGANGAVLGAGASTAGCGAGAGGVRPVVAAGLPGRADLLAAAARIAPYVVRTPLLPGPVTAAHGTGLLLKAEHLQLGGSFKMRGAANAVLALGADRVVTGSSGNHGIALARIARTLGIRLTVVLAAGAMPSKAAAIRALGAETVQVGGGVAEREERARALAAEQDAVLVPSSDHPLVVAGQGTVGLELLAAAPDTETVYVPTGGGGLLAGLCLAAAGHPVRVVGVEPALTPRYARSLAAGHPVRLPPCATVADGLRGQSPGAVPYPIIRNRVDELIAVGDAEILAATALLHRLGVDAEPSGAVALAGALRAGRRERAVAIVSGGNTPARLHTPQAHTGTSTSTDVHI
ncbi:pyridoxal-phosphate dependent enzyme [Streptomyces sp. SUK 48]|uniref:threonine ammonia-lyase n=1 Tax=Streptomyces sp. SUK 48 TaxID=2582831 RepID=UPI0023B9DD13|nr:pyridoxal-phosphate dependent enzyme [Streptomyces sp. SUK 48]